MQHQVITLNKLFIAVAVSSTITLANATSTAGIFDLAGKDAAAGRYVKSIDSLLSLDKSLRALGNWGELMESKLKLAEVYLSFGKKQQARQTLESAYTWRNKLPATKSGKRNLCRLYHQMGRLYLQNGQATRAARFFTAAIEAARMSGLGVFQALAYNSLGEAQQFEKRLQPAIASFQQSLSLARKSGDAPAMAMASINLARAYLDNGDSPKLEPQLQRSIEYVDNIIDAREKSRYLLSISDIYRIAGRKFAKKFASNNTREKSGNKTSNKRHRRLHWRLKALSLAQRSIPLANAHNDKLLMSYGYGYLSRLYTDEGRYRESMVYARRAMFLAQEVNAANSLYRWEWQVARNLNAMGRSTEAVLVYRQAMKTLSRIRSEIIVGSRQTFRQTVGPLYFEYADLLLRSTAAMADKKQAAAYLKEVRNVLEQLKIAEIQDYFQNDCLISDENAALVDHVSRRRDTAVIYPVLLNDRLELLVSTSDGLRQYTSAVGLKEITENVRSLRRHIETYSSGDGHLPYARNLYRWLIAPAEAQLQAQRGNGIKTLVVIPDGPLRSIPVSVLHDGRQYLVEKYAVATTPGLLLTNPVPLARKHIKVLANGLTKSVQGMDALPSVGYELDSIDRLYQGKFYRDERFLRDEVQKELSQGGYNVVHFATHAEFSSNHNDSYLMAFDGKITLNRLEQSVARRRFHNQPIELLVLSACRTAAGDDRAALGLAGVAVKAGARSALATLWYINDRATASLISTFYKNLENKSLSKAQALRLAQLSLLRHRSHNLRHPTYWAPFLMIGNWL